MRKILMIEDDADLLEIMEDYFLSRCWQVVKAANGSSGLQRAKETAPDFILHDINLPDLDGFEVCRRIRLFSDVLLIFITARSSEFDKLNGYACGADDYITKPFSLPVLSAKIAALSSRDMAVIDELRFGPLRIIPTRREVYVDDRPVVLAPREYDILSFLCSHESRIYTREQLLMRFWGELYEGNERVVDDHIRKLRKALGSARGCIVTIHKQGYMFSPERR
ncbi:MAG: response regulator transcription factor [Solobacterium sp.]|nr:response regulator transcription factor [Solobacterium sp.]